MVDAVQERQHRTVWGERRQEIVDCGVEVVGFADNEDEVVWAADGARLHGFDRGSKYVVTRPDRQPSLSKFRRPTRPDQKRHVGAASLQHPAVVTAKRPGADDQKPHGEDLPFYPAASDA